MVRIDRALLEDEIAELCTHIDAATCRLLRAIAEFDRREAWRWGFESTAHWLTWRVGIDLVTAREKVRVARALEGLLQKALEAAMDALTEEAKKEETDKDDSAESCRHLACDAPHVTVSYEDDPVDEE